MPERRHGWRSPRPRAGRQGRQLSVQQRPVRTGSRPNDERRTRLRARTALKALGEQSARRPIPEWRHAGRGPRPSAEYRAGRQPGRTGSRPNEERQAGPRARTASRASGERLAWQPMPELRHARRGPRPSGECRARGRPASTGSRPLEERPTRGPVDRSGARRGRENATAQRARTALRAAGSLPERRMQTATRPRRRGWVRCGGQCSTAERWRSVLQALQGSRGFAVAEDRFPSAPGQGVPKRMTAGAWPTGHCPAEACSGARRACCRSECALVAAEGRGAQGCRAGKGCRATSWDGRPEVARLRGRWGYVLSPHRRVRSPRGRPERAAAPVSAPEAWTGTPAPGAESGSAWGSDPPLARLEGPS